VAGLVQATTSETSLLDVLATLDDETVQYLAGDKLPPNWRETLPVAMAIMQLDPAILRRFPGGDQIDPSFLEQQQEWRNGLSRIVDEAQGVARNVLADSGADELIPAFDAGIVKLSQSGLADDGDPDRMIGRWVELLKDLLQDSKTRLLFDDEVGKLVRSLVNEGHVNPNSLSLKHASEAAVGSGLIARLPAFPQAPIDEVLHLRNDLDGSLTRYRRAVSNFSGKLEFRSFDPEASAELDDLWTNEVLPALAEIREGFAEHGLVREIAKAIGADLKIVSRTGTGAAVFIGLDNFTAVGGLLAATVATIGPAAQAAAQIALARDKARRDLEQRELFYLYEVDRQLG
jgi:hypothetical protein